MFEKGEKHPNYITGDCDMAKNKMYRTYRGILQRCNNEKSDYYKNYGGRGIKNEWTSYKQFKEDMEISYLEHVEQYGKKDTSIDRIDNNGNYCKKNCKWATQKEQANNTRANYRHNINGVDLTIYEIKKTYTHNPCIDNQTIIYRLLAGWGLEEALQKPLGFRKTEELETKNLWRLTNREKEIAQYRALGHTLESIAEKYGITRERIRQILVASNQKLLKP